MLGARETVDFVSPPAEPALASPGAAPASRGGRTPRGPAASSPTGPTVLSFKRLMLEGRDEANACWRATAGPTASHAPLPAAGAALAAVEELQRWATAHADVLQAARETCARLLAS